MLITGFPPRERERAGAHLECVGELLRDAEDIRRTGSAALDLAYVACGRADAYFEAGVKPWDIAAGVLLVREAGGKRQRLPRRRHRPDGRARHRSAASSWPATSSSATRCRRRIVQSGYAAAFD